MSRFEPDAFDMFADLPTESPPSPAKSNIKNPKTEATKALAFAMGPAAATLVSTAPWVPPPDDQCFAGGTVYAPVRFVLRVSRPGLWVPTMLTFLVGLAAPLEAAASPGFWAGLFYCGWPFNTLIMGWNDMMDADIDRLNPRKIKAQKLLSGPQMKAMPLLIAATNIPFAAAAYYYLGAPKTALLLANGLGSSLAYDGVGDGWPMQWSRVPGLDVFTIVWMYLFPLHVAYALFGVPTNGLARLAWCGLCLARCQAAAAHWDAEADALQGKGTVATFFGRANCEWVMLAMWAAETLVVGETLGCFKSAVVHATGVGAWAAIKALSMGSNKVSAGKCAALNRLIVDQHYAIQTVTSVCTVLELWWGSGSGGDGGAAAAHFLIEVAAA